MYADRLRTLNRAYNSADRSNKLYEDARRKQVLQEEQMRFLEGLQMQIQKLDLTITRVESEWRKDVLSILEAEIIKDLSYVYPTDGYTVSLTSKIMRSKIHIDAEVRSLFSDRIPGRIQKTQGRLFQQVVSFAALRSTMSLLGVNTIYVDEAFSGSSKRNVAKLNNLLASLEERGYNLVMIAQDTAIADNIKANRLFLTRSIDNKTQVAQEVGASDGC